MMLLFVNPCASENHSEWSIIMGSQAQSDHIPVDVDVAAWLVIGWLIGRRSRCHQNKVNFP